MRSENRELDVQSLRANEEWLRVTLSSIGDGVITTDNVGLVTFLNPVAQSLTGWTQEEAVGQPLDKVFVIVDVLGRNLENPAARALREGIVTLPQHTYLVSKDGARRSVDDSAAPIRNTEGVVAGVVLIFRDVTERELAETMVLASELQYRRLFETARDGILILDAETWKIIDANSFIGQMTGFPPEEFLGKELWEIGLFQDVEANRRAFQTLLREGYVRYDDLPLKSKSGAVAEVEFISNLYEVDSKRIIQCNVRDITERKRVEEKVRQQADALAEISRRKDEFLAMLGHELRNPLSAISSAIKVVRLSASEQAKEEAAAIIDRQADHLARLVDDLLDISRVTTGRIQVRKEPVQVSAFIHDAVDTTRPLINKEGHTLVVSLPAFPIWVEGDPLRLQQVVSNLLANAAKYTTSGGRIVLTADVEDRNVVIRVRDTGIGLAADHLQRIFDLFVQVDRTLDRSQGGLGLGLSITKTLVEMHGGTVEAHSAGLGKGSVFVVRLPTIHTVARQPQPTKDASPPVQSRMRVLVVDDNMDAANALVMLLQIVGHDARVVYSGVEATKSALEYQPHLVLMDIGMPDMDGYAVAKEMRADPALKSTVLIAVTGYGQEGDIARSRESGFAHHLVKPLDFLELRKLLASVVVSP